MYVSPIHPQSCFKLAPNLTIKAGMPADKTHVMPKTHVMVEQTSSSEIKDV